MRKPFAPQPSQPPVSWRLVRMAFFLFAALPLRADNANLAEEVRQLRAENALLQKQVRQQGEQLNALVEKVAGLESARPTAGGNDQQIAHAKGV